jgi:hypothetical protein
MAILSIRNVGTTTRDAITGAEEGAALGAELGPVGAAVGALAGSLLGYEFGDDAVEVTFSCHGGGIRTYRYVGQEAKAILSGANPSDFAGTRIS